VNQGEGVYTPPIIGNFQYSQATEADFIDILRFFCEIFLQILVESPLPLPLSWVLRAATGKGDEFGVVTDDKDTDDDEESNGLSLLFSSFQHFLQLLRCSETVTISRRRFNPKLI